MSHFVLTHVLMSHYVLTRSSAIAVPSCRILMIHYVSTLSSATATAFTFLQYVIIHYSVMGRLAVRQRSVRASGASLR